MLARHQYLKEMGIDVWVERGNRSLRAASTLSESEPVNRPSPGPKARLAVPAPRPADMTAPAGAPVSASVPATAPESKPADRGPVPHFHLCFSRYGRLGICFSLPEDAKGMSDSLRRFTDDVAFALGVSEQPAIHPLSWPMVSSSHIDQSAAAANTALRQRTRKAGDILLVFGAAAREFAAPHCQGQVVLLDEIESYLATPLRKRDLWQAIRDLRPLLSK